MDVWLLGLFLGYENLPERAGDLWDEMKELRFLISWEETHRDRDPITSVKRSELAVLELEFRAILIEAESLKIKNKRGY